MLPEEDLKIIIKELGREPTMVERGCFLNMWSEHCSYKSSRRFLRRYLPPLASHVVLGPGEDAVCACVYDERSRAPGGVGPFAPGLARRQAERGLGVLRHADVALAR